MGSISINISLILLAILTFIWLRVKCRRYTDIGYQWWLPLFVFCATVVSFIVLSVATYSTMINFYGMYDLTIINSVFNSNASVGAVTLISISAIIFIAALMVDNLDIFIHCFKKQSKKLKPQKKFIFIVSGIMVAATVIISATFMTQFTGQMDATQEDMYNYTYEDAQLPEAEAEIAGVFSEFERTVGDTELINLYNSNEALHSVFYQSSSVRLKGYDLGDKCYVGSLYVANVYDSKKNEYPLIEIGILNDGSDRTIKIDSVYVNGQKITIDKEYMVYGENVLFIPIKLQKIDKLNVGDEISVTIDGHALHTTLTDTEE